ncbi:hypothetical protein GGS20DRAFT_582688 [Poronia punctata]|nr:hypothetical protein GGS20DRAFT_582688 [Poronia punctata]
MARRKPLLKSAFVDHQNRITSRRHLVIRHERRLIALAKGDGNGDDSGSDTDREILPELDPGQEQLKSYFKPALPAGDYSINVEQTVERTSSDYLKFKSTHGFSVIAPQVSLPVGSVYSVYPPQGHSDTVDILPHVVLNDPHLPWERTAAKEELPDDSRNKVPWLALLVFTQDELRVSDSVLADTFGGKGQSDTTLAIHSSIAEVKSGSQAGVLASPLGDLGLADDTNLDVVCIEPKLFTALVTKYQDGTATPSEGQMNPDISRYRFLSHVRNINMTGMAGIETQEDGLFSIVVSHRVGPLHTTQPTTMVAHLVSIEGVESMSLPLTAEHVVLCSLHSWTYNSLPATSLTPFDLFTHVGKTLDVLRAPDSVINKLGDDDISKRIASRLRDGYTMTKYRMRTGEVTAAITRGPFTPTTVPHPVSDDWKGISNSGDNFQILDRELGIMDISYSVAWNLGKAMAIADQNFSAALGRLRSVIFDKTMEKAKVQLLKKNRGFMTRKALLSTLLKLPESMAGLHIKAHSSTPYHLRHRPSRWLRRSFKPIDLSLRSHTVRYTFSQHIGGVASKLSKSLQGRGRKGTAFYDGHNTPLSGDWAIVLDWVLDRMYLIDMPAHVLIPDASFLPEESLRFFHIDANWRDAFLDGALSVANYAGSDIVRSHIKLQIVEFLKTDRQYLDYPAQIPTYGFLLRSKLVKLFPDLKVTADRPKDDPRAPILRLENIDEEVMLCLFDRVPSQGGFDLLTFTQPPHQQCFSAAASLGLDHFETVYKRIHEDGSEVDENRSEPLGNKTWKPGDANPVFIWGDEPEIRTLLFPAWAEDVFREVKSGMKKLGYKFDDEVPSAALSAYQLNSSIYHMPISLPSGSGFSAEMDDSPQTLKLLGVDGWDVKPKLEVEDIETVRNLPDTETPHDLKTRLTPMPSTLPLPQPHFRRARYRADLKTEVSQPELLEPPTSAAARRPDPAQGGIATVPEVTFSVHSWGKEIGTGVPMGNGVPQDLVFGVQCTADKRSSYKLKQLRITAALGDTSKAPSKYYLTANYRGPGATMLGNLRLCPRVTFGDDGTSLNVLLVPRSRTGKVPVENVSDMSFVLPMVEINGYKKDVDVTLTYSAVWDSQHKEGSFKISLVRA